MDGPLAKLVADAGLDPAVAMNVTSFGDTEAMQNELAELVVAGTKRATTSLRRWYLDDALPQVGGLFVVIDGRGLPRCICRTTVVEVRPFSAVDAAYAWEEGEGDRSLRSWRDDHRAFFIREAERECFAFCEDADVVLEWFEVVWPPPAHATDPTADSL